MGKNCLVEYLTPACATCPNWADGTDDRGIGCATHYPIMWCEHFSKMCQEEEEARRICQKCRNYDRLTKTCARSGVYTSRKSGCEYFAR